MTAVQQECIRRPNSYWSSCTCSACKVDRAKKRKMQYVGYQRRVPSDVAWRILSEKFAALWSARAVGSATGLPVDYFNHHLAQWRKGRVVEIGPNVALRIARMRVPTEGQISAEVSRRKLRALAVMGHGLDTVSMHTGVAFSTLAMIRNSNERIGAGNAAKIAAVYDDLHMTLGSDQQAMSVARAKGWVGPLDWTDIDDLSEVVGSVEQEADDVDPVVVERILAGENLPANRAERYAVIDAWLARGGSATSLENLTGWAVWRLIRDRDKAAA